MALVNTEYQTKQLLFRRCEFMKMVLAYNLRFSVMLSLCNSTVMVFF
jgi:hypothetical protein